jgi:hypothetical protein
MSLAQRTLLLPAAATDRAVVVAALNTIEWAHALPEAPDTPTPGACWPRWDQTTYGGQLSAPAQPAYLVYALLPSGDMATTVDAGDQYVTDLVGALWGLGRIEYAEPTSVPFEDGSAPVPAVRVRLVIRG